MDSSQDCVVKLENVEVKSGTNCLLSGVSVDIKEGHIYGLISQNGIGKTTLMKVIAGIMKFSGGSIIAHQDVRIGYSIDDSLLIEGLTACQNITYYMKLCGQYDKDYLDIIIDCLDMGDFIDVVVKKMSKGMKQRTSLAISLVKKPNLLLWDEAISGVDFIHAKKIFEIIKDIKEKNNITVIVSEHNIETFIDFCTDFIFLTNNKKVVCLPKEKVLINSLNDAKKLFADILENNSYGSD